MFTIYNLYKKDSKERYYYDLYQPNLNNNVPGRTQEQSKLQYRTRNITDY